MSDLSKKILESGLVDEATASLMERWGVIDPNEADLARRAKLQDAGREALIKFADSIEVELEKQRRLRETMLDLDHLRWPVTAIIRRPDAPIVEGVPTNSFVARASGVIDRMGRYYFRPADVQKDWFVPGYTMKRDINDGHKLQMRTETIVEVTELYIGEQVAAIQVSTQ